MARTNEFGQLIGDELLDWQPRALPPGADLAGRGCTVVPLELAHVAGLAAAFAGMNPADWTYLPTSRPDDEPATLVVLTRLLEMPNAVPYTVLVDGVAQGTLSLMRADTANGVIEIGWVVMGTTIQRTPVTTEAQRLLMGHVFDDLGYRRLEWKCDALNEPSRRAAARLGYTFEGVFGQHMVLKGRSRDSAWFALLDHEWPDRRARLDAWLDPANFGPDGVQLSALSAAAAL